jgi:BMFP domain-containing protein YqiC
MNKKNGILHDISRLASSAFSSVVGVKREVSASLRSQIEDYIKGMNFVRREEFEALHKMVLSQKKQIDALAKDHPSHDGKLKPQMQSKPKASPKAKKAVPSAEAKK